MTDEFSTSNAKKRCYRALLLGSPALSVMLLAGQAAMAASPAAGSLPGAFSTNTVGTTYKGSGSAGVITIGSTGSKGQVLQFGGSALPNAVTPGGALSSATNSGFSVGSGASLKITGGAALPTLINDQSGSASQIYGSVNAGGLGGPLFVSNVNGVVVGAGGTFTGPSAGTGLLGYAADSNSFANTGTIGVNTATAGTGAVTVDPAATVGGGVLLVASNGAISVGAAPSSGVDVLAGYSFTTGTGTPVGSVGNPLPNSTATVAFTGGTTATPLLVAGLDAAGSVANSGILSLQATGSIAGAFTNTGIATTPALSAGSITNTGVLNISSGFLTTINQNATSGADITNSGIINVSGSQFVAQAGSSQSGYATGNFNNTGQINFTTPGSTNFVVVSAANINFAGSVQATPSGKNTTPSALSATNPLSDLVLSAGYGVTKPAVTGVVDYGTSIYADIASLTGGAVRILSGNLSSPAAGGSIGFTLGAGQVADPFTKTTLGNNLSVFPNAMVQADFVYVQGTATTATQVGSNINLDGVLSTQVKHNLDNEVYITDVNNVTGGGGLAVNNGGSVIIDGFTGNVNHPTGASAFQYNYLPIAVADANSGQAGTVTLTLSGPSSSSTTPQNINVLVEGNVKIVNPAKGYTPPLTPGGTPSSIIPATSYANNHLVLQATGNIATGAAKSGFYWPGLVYLNTVASAANPTVQSASGSITLNGPLNNVLPAAVTGNAGIFFETNNLVLNGTTVTTNNNSWVNFISPQVAQAYATTSASSFFGAYLDQITSTVTELSLKPLPTASFQ